MNSLYINFLSNFRWQKLSAIRDFSLLVLFIDLLLCGPLGIANERKFIFAIVVLLCFIHFVKFHSIQNKSQFRKPIVLLFLISLIWLLPIPFFSEGNLIFAFEEWDAILFLLIPIFYLPGINSHTKFISIVFWSSFLISSCIFILWILANLNKTLLDVIETSFIAVYQKDSIFIGFADIHNNDKFPRIFFINLLWVFVSFFYLPTIGNNKYFNYIIAVIFVGIFIISYSRGLNLAFLISLGIIGLLSIRKFIALSKFFLIGLIFSSFFFINQFQFLENRILSLSQIFSTNELTTEQLHKDPSFKVREMQNKYLLEEWKKNKFFGKGFGSYVEEFPSSPNAPYSYEATPFALLMKFGVIGIGLLIVFGIFLFYRAVQLRDKNFISLALGGLLFLFLSGMTNPYILNSIGMGIFIFFILVLMGVEFNEKRER